VEESFYWPDVAGLSGRVSPESLAGCSRIKWPGQTGIRILIALIISFTSFVVGIALPSPSPIESSENNDRINTDNLNNRQDVESALKDVRSVSENMDSASNIKEILNFTGTMTLNTGENSVIMTIESNVPDGGIFEIGLVNGDFDILSDFVEIKDGKVEKEFIIPPEWEIGYYTGIAAFRFNLEDHPQPENIRNIYGEKGEKMTGGQAVETFDGGHFGDVESVTIAYPSEAAVQERINEIFISTLKELIKSSNGVIKKIEPDGTWQIVLVTVSDSWYYSMDHEKERFAETVGGAIETIIRNAGKVNENQSVSVYFYDSYGKELATPKFWGGYNIKR